MLNNATLIDIYGLNNVCQIAGSLNIIGNDELVSIVGLNINEPTTIEIGNNPNLLICDVFSLCTDFFVPQPNLYNNGISCSAQELFESCTPLPIELVSFQAQIQNRTVLLTWETATETNNQGFDIERSLDAVNWQKIGWQDGAGNSTTKQLYRYTDEEPLAGTSYYRLRQIDFDGSSSYSEIESIRFHDDNTIEIYPNPAKEVLYISKFNENKSKQIIIYDQTGRPVLTTTQTSNKIDIADLVPQIYVISIIAEGEAPFYAKFIVSQ